ncbi:hypothetical protein [Agromyces sp. S2-1-8]|uniref:hypothetical protein n=1 Tax=unclassified Agromyces TaxID=2639701 RepID=UPI001E485B69|nr:hypothetical protein [Agromyces sp. S2-1-8]MCD5346223.1 hypothetical protein [Agromyces sp. S2-1-8]
MPEIVYEAHVDHAKVDRTGRWNSGMLLTSAAIGVLLAVGLAVAVIAGLGWFTITIASLGVAACAVSVLLASRRRRALGLLVTDDDVAVAVETEGIRLAGAPLIPWTEIVFVGVLDDRARSARVQDLPFSGPLARATVRSGSATLLCEIGVRDGEALRRAFAGARGADRVTLFDRFDGTRRGLIPLMLDAVIDDATALQAAQVLIREAERRGIPARSFTKVFAYFEWKGPMIDLKWPVEKKGIA